MEKQKTHHITTQLPTRQKHRRPRHIPRHPRPPQRDPPLHVLPLDRIIQILIVQLRLYRPRQQRITPYVVLPQRDGARLHEREHTRLGGRVVGLQTTAYEGADGGDADDGAARGGLRRHLAGGGLGGVEGAGEVGVEGGVEEVFLKAVFESVVSVT